MWTTQKRVIMNVKNLYFSLLFLLFFYALNAQVGVGNTNPQAQLDISASSTTSPSNDDGILIPRMSAFPSTPGATRDGMLIFYTGTGADGKGFYYWDQGATSWVKIAAGSTDDNDWTEVSADIKRQSGDVYIGDSNTTDNDLYLSNRLIDWDNNSYYLDPQNTSRLGQIQLDNISFTGPSLFFATDNTTGISGGINRVGIVTDGSTNHQFTEKGQLEFYYRQSVLLGNNAGDNLSASFNDAVFIGEDAGENTTTGLGNIALGRSALNDNITGGSNIAIGSYTMALSTGGENIGVGGLTFRQLTSGSRNVAFGVAAGYPDTNSSDNTYIGHAAGGSIPSSNFNRTGNVFLGFQAGYNQNVSNRLFIENSDSANPLIYGEFDNDIIRINGELQVLDPFGTGYSFPVTDGTTNQVMTTDGAGNVTFQDIIGDGTGTDNQTIDNLSLSGTILRLSLEDDGQPLQTVNLASLQDGIGTDDQNLTAPTLTGTTLNLGIENGTGTSVNLVTLQDGTGTDNQTIDNLSLSGTTLRLSLEDDGQPLQTVNLASLQDGTGTDDQNLTAPTLTGTTLNLGIENGTGTSVNLATLQDGTGTDNQTIDNLSLLGTTLRLSLEDDGQPLQTVNLASLQDGTGTDDQNLTTPTLAGTTLNLGIENGTGTSVNLASLQDGTGTDDQNIQSLGFNTATNILTVGIENGAAQSVNLSVLDSGGDVNGVIAGTGLTGGGFSGNVTINAVGTNGLTTNADDIRLGGTLIQNTTITQGARSFDINLNSTGDFAIQDNGTDVFFVEDSGDIGFGNSNPIYKVHVTENTATETRAVYVDKDDNTAASTEGVYVTKTSNGTGRNHGYYAEVNGTGNGNRYGLYADVTGTGTGQKYGIFNELNSNTAGSQYAVRNWVRGASGSNQFGVFNNMDNANTADIYGVYNGMRVTNASNMYGVYNEFLTTSSSADLMAGVRTRFTNGTPGSNGFSGIYTDFDLASNGTFYGVRNEYSAGSTGTGNKYGSYNFISASAGGTHYGTYNSVGVTNGWASYNLGKSYISQRLSIGETDNADGRITILNNSGGSNPAHIQFTETNANDGSRIQFANGAETTNEWTLYGRADNTLSDSSFNFFHTTTGNILEIKGDGDVEINGQLGININDPTYAITLPNNTAIGTGRGRANAWTIYSDSRVKSNQQPLQNGLHLIKQMVPKTYFHHNGNIEDGVLNLSENGEQTLGFIAQELYKIFPEAVQRPKDESKTLWSVDYDKVIPVVVKALQELNNQVETLESENNKLKQQLRKIEQLEARLITLEGTSGDNTSKTTSK